MQIQTSNEGTCQSQMKTVGDLVEVPPCHEREYVEDLLLSEDINLNQSIHANETVPMQVQESLLREEYNRQAGFGFITSVYPAEKEYCLKIDAQLPFGGTVTATMYRPNHPSSGWIHTVLSNTGVEEDSLDMLEGCKIPIVPITDEEEYEEALEKKNQPFNLALAESELIDTEWQPYSESQAAQEYSIEGTHMTGTELVSVGLIYATVLVVAQSTFAGFDAIIIASFVAGLAISIYDSF